MLKETVQYEFPDLAGAARLATLARLADDAARRLRVRQPGPAEQGGEGAGTQNCDNPATRGTRIE
jgi:hypothetical protein